MADMCGQCLNIDWSNKEQYTSRNRYYCDEMRKYVDPKDSACGYFDEDKSKTKEQIEGFTPSGCSYSVIIRDILGYPDNCEMLNLFRNFRENYLKKNNAYIPLLLEYDQISPIICKHLENCEDKINYSLRLMQNFLIPCSYSIKSGNNEEAIAIYQNFWNSLKTKFGLENTKIELNDNYNLETLGKGRIRQPKTSEI